MIFSWAGGAGGGGVPKSVKQPCLTVKTGLPLGLFCLPRRGLVAGRWSEDVLAKGLKQGGGEVWVDASGMGVILCS
eukprot:COSAG05_NODE_4885_length_1324_cov_3.045271_2_plen_76_part_00